MIHAGLSICSPVIDEALPPGTRISGYVVERVLGRGGFAFTYLAHDEHLTDSRYALKEFFPQELARRTHGVQIQATTERAELYRQGLAGFLQEGRALLNLHRDAGGIFRHVAGIVRVHRYVEEHGTAYLVMDYVAGQSLEQALAARPRECWHEASVRRLATQLLEALAEVHAAGLLHRDISPSNIVLDKKDRPTLIDFGASRLQLAESTHTNNRVAKAGYSPPEQYGANMGEQGAWSDLYSLGATLYEVVTGNCVPEAMARVAADRKGKDPFRPAAQVAPAGYSSAFLEWIDWHLALDEDARPRSVAASLARLASVRQPENGAAPEVATAQPVKTAPVHPAKRFSAQPASDNTPPKAQSTSAQAEPSPTPTARVDPAKRFEGHVPPAKRPPKGPEDEPVTPVVPAAPPKASTRRWAVALSVVAVASALGFSAIKSWRADSNDNINAAVEPAAVPVAKVPDAPTVLPVENEAHAPGKPFRDPLKSGGEGPEMVVIPAGRFLMGSPAAEKGRSDNEGPQREVSVRRFAMGTTEVTFADYDRCTAAGRCGKADDNGWGRGTRPVIHVSWEDGQKYAAWLNAETGKKYRLPTEAEWEYAARAGTTGPFSFEGVISPAKANYDSSGTYGGSLEDSAGYRGLTVPGGSLPANPWGLHEVHGNVWEWAQDCYRDTYVGAPRDGSAVEVTNCEYRVLRGGTFHYYPDMSRSAARYGSSPTFSPSYVGFRLARTL